MSLSLWTMYTSYMFGILITAPLLAPPFVHFFVNCHNSEFVFIYPLGQSLCTTIVLLLTTYYAYWPAWLDVVLVIFNYYDLYFALVQGRRLCCMTSKAIFLIAPLDYLPQSLKTCIIFCFLITFGRMVLLPAFAWQPACFFIFPHEDIILECTRSQKISFSARGGIY